MSGPGDQLVGREAELAHLVDALPGEGRGSHLVLLVGEAGIGKSRLLDELVAEARSRGLDAVRGMADEHEQIPFGLWIGSGRTLGAPFPGADRTLTPTEQRWERLTWLADALVAAAPVIVVLDDLHWADDSSLWILERVVREVAGHEVSFFASSRPGTSDSSDRWRTMRRSADVVALTGLDAPRVAELLEQLGGSAAEAEALCDRTGGNPLFLREVAGLGSLTLPAVLSDLLLGPIEALDGGGSDTLTVLALAGRDAPPAVVASASSRPVAEVIGHLDAARDADIVRADDRGALWFRHALLADAARSRLDEDGRRRVEQRLARAWLEVGDGRLPSRSASARHRLAALPDADLDPGELTDVLVELTAEQIESGAAAEAEQLLSAATAAFERFEPGAVVDRARLALALGDARWVLGDRWLAAKTFERADDLLSAVDGPVDPELRARALASACRYADPFLGEPDRRRRLREVEQELPPGDHPLRVLIWGRQVALAVADPEAMVGAHAAADEGIEMARRIGEPELIIGALMDRYQTPTSPADLAARARAADEIVELSRRIDRRDHELVGLEWQFTSRLTRADVQGALATLDELEARAQVMPSPLWRYVAATRRVGILALSGDRDGAVELAHGAAGLARNLLPPEEVSGVQAGGILSTLLVYGTPDRVEVAAQREAVETLGSIPLLFLQVHVAVGLLLAGHIAEARRIVDRWAPQAQLGLHGLEGPGTVATLAMLVVRTGAGEHAGPLRRLLEPFSGLLPIGNGIAAAPPFDQTLAGLALLDGDVDAAIAHANAALALSRSMPAPPFEALALDVLAQARLAAGDDVAARAAHDAARAIAEPIDLVVTPLAIGEPGPGRPTESRLGADRGARLRELVDGWEIESPYGAGQVPASRGFDQLARLLDSTGVEVGAVELAGMATGSGGALGAVAPAADLGPSLDARAKREYRERVSELQAEVDEADAHADLERASRARAELDVLLDELRRAVGLGGRDRPSGSGAERARVNVARSLRRAITAVESAIPGLGAHLRVSVRTGRSCAYDPEPAAALDWTVIRR